MNGNPHPAQVDANGIPLTEPDSEHACADSPRRRGLLRTLTTVLGGDLAAVEDTVFAFYGRPLEVVATVRLSALLAHIDVAGRRTPPRPRVPIWRQ